MNWKQYIAQLSSAQKGIVYHFHPPVPDAVLQDVQRQLVLQEWPAALSALYRETDGVDEMMYGEKTGELIWPAKRLLATNLEYRSDPGFNDLYMSFDQLLFFADAGNGDLFGFVILGGRCLRHDVFVWNHEDDSRQWVAPDLARFLEWWINGNIKV